mmetsp:Transcript_1930/g.2680  ORF Transcript_1930/g.2680 Transcript_1930/m.2680 type:complete len:504 (-) Transcript_1930:619-2130(-)
MASYNGSGGGMSYTPYGVGDQMNYGHTYGTATGESHNGLRRRATGTTKPEPMAKFDQKKGNIVNRLDFMFPKVEQEFCVQTEKGGLTTMVAILVIAILSLGEIVAWVSENNSTSEHIAVNTELNKRMRINMNITFPALACEDLHVDAMDVAGDSQIDLEDTLVKKQLRRDGTVKSAEEIQVETNKHREEQEKKEKILRDKLPEDYCGSCFGAEEEEGQCCQTCDDVLKAYQTKRWKSTLLIYTAEQCIREGRDKKELKRMTKGQGCNLSGYMTVNRVAGNFHIAMGEGVERDGRHIHSFLPEDAPNFNASHIIHQLSFGPGEENKAVMNNIKKIVGPEHGTTGLFQYFIKVVPTTYIGKDLIPNGSQQAQAMPSLFEEVEKNEKKEDMLETNRYFFTERFRPLMTEFIAEEHMDEEKATVNAGHKGGHGNDDHHNVKNSVLPGVFFIYEIFPFAVEISRKSVPLSHLLIRLIAIVGGVFTFAGWLDSALGNDDKSARRRSHLV